MRPVVIIPVYNHAEAIGWMVEGVRRQRLHCVLVDDGCEPVCARVLDALQADAPDEVEVVRLERNGGKGAAVLAGARHALARGYTHGVQIDADGQHDPECLPQFLAASRLDPEAVVCGVPRYDASVPKGRLYGRYLTHVWVWINTLSFAIQDSMCGYRVYPLAALCRLADEEHLGQRMDFDPEVMVRLAWRGHPVVNLPTPVTYPRDGVSHFDLWRDNLRISRMHARLFFGMLRRLPRLLWRRLQ